MIYAALITVSVNYGLGKKRHLADPANVVPMFKHMFIGEFFTLIAIPTSKTSFSITLLRLATKKWQKWFIWYVIVSVNIVYWLCAALILGQCQPIAKNWDKSRDGSCWDASIQDNYAIFAGCKSTVPCSRFARLIVSQHTPLSSTLYWPGSPSSSSTTCR